jgi:hypothetical protein
MLSAFGPITDKLGVSCRDLRTMTRTIRDPFQSDPSLRHTRRCPPRVRRGNQGIRYHHQVPHS